MKYMGQDQNDHVHLHCTVQVGAWAGPVISSIQLNKWPSLRLCRSRTDGVVRALKTKHACWLPLTVVQLIGEDGG